MLKRPMFLATCLFGICFIVLENSSHNSIAFAQNTLDASHATATPGKIIAIAFAVNTFCCLLHAISRRWGIIVNNVFGTVKFLILVFVIIIGLIWIDRDVASSNYAVSTSFSTANSPILPYRYAEAFLWVIFPYGAFHQLNYVRFNLLGMINLQSSLCQTVDNNRSSLKWISHGKHFLAPPSMEFWLQLLC
jgi:amino acid transporter